MSKPSPRTSVLALLLALLVAVLAPVGVTVRVAPAQAAEGPAKKRPNIVVVMADDMRVDDLRFAPRTRRLVGRHGLTVRNAFSPYPLCCPARASFLTGVHTHRHRVWSHEAPWGYRAFDDSRTLATSLKRAGYRTGFIGKYLNGYGPQTSKVSGEASYRYVPRGWTDWRAAFENPGVPGIHGGTYAYFDTPYNVNGRVVNRFRGRYQTNVIGDLSVEMARRMARRPSPFFMYVNYVAPHHGAPFEKDDPGSVRTRDGDRVFFDTPARPTWVKGRFDSVVTRAAGLPRGGGPAERDVSDKPAVFRNLPEPNRRERAAMREVTRQRAESILVMDREIARLVRVLRKSGEWRDTVFAFTSDNGYFLGEHRKRQGKVLGHEPSLRVPLLLTGPGMRGKGTGHQRYDPMTLLDLSATIIDLAGARAPYAPDGASKLATLRRGDLGWTVPVLHESGWQGGAKVRGFHDRRTSIGVRTGRYSLLRSRHFGELYDLAEDPLQNRNVWGAPGYRGVRRKLLSVWTDLKDCRGGGCQIALPADLAADPDTTRRLTRAYWRRVEEVYGW
jgi:N-acetylglucosamine-6-sulfatase